MFSTIPMQPRFVKEIATKSAFIVAKPSVQGLLPLGRGIAIRWTDDSIGADDLAGAASDSYLYVPNALNSSPQGEFDQWSRHRIGVPAEFNFRPKVLARDLKEHVGTRRDRFSSQSSELLAEAGGKILQHF
jgi:hypothetical protein